MYKGGMTHPSLVDKAIELAKGQTALARKFNEHGYGTVRQGHVWKWKAAGKFPPYWADAVETVTGGRIRAKQVIQAAQRQKSAA